MLIDAGIDPERGAVDFATIPGTLRSQVNIAVTAAKALTDDRTHGLGANATGAEPAVRSGVGSVVVDVRCSDGSGHAVSCIKKADVGSSMDCDYHCV